jgi:acyl homoserine lactone synthase
VEISAGTSSFLSRELVARLARYRHKVFVEKLGWQLQTEDGMEFDQFDRPDTLYVIARNEDDQVVGGARLLPTTQPYLLGEVFPQLLNGLQVPRSDDVWELSRFAAVDLDVASSVFGGQFSSPIAVGLLQAAIDAAAQRGAKRLITVSPLGVERLLRKAGFEAHRAGPPMIVGGHPIFACWIELR